MKYLITLATIFLLLSCSDSSSPNNPEKSEFVGKFSGNTSIWDWMYSEWGECSFEVDDINGKPMLTKITMFWAYSVEIHDGVRRGRGYHTVELSNGIVEINDRKFNYQSTDPYMINIIGEFITKDSIAGTVSGESDTGDKFSGTYESVRINQ